MIESQTASVLACIKQHNERLDFEVAEQTGASIDVVRRIGHDLISTGKVISCTVTRYRDGQPIEASLYRVTGYTPPPAPGRKSRPAS